MLKHIDQQFGKAHARAMKQWKEGKLPKRRGVRKIDVSGAVDALAASRMIPSAYEMPCWIDGTKRNYVALRNSILDLDSLQSLPHSPEWFSTVRLDYDYLPDATEPRLEGWLRDWFGDDQELAALAQEWAGYCLTRSTDAQSFLMCIGDGANGKGAYAAMLQAIIGVDNCSYQGWSGLGERFGLAPVVGKQLNFSDEAAQFSRHTEETLKRYTGGSALTIEEKNQPAFKMLPTARLMAACNEFPRIVDRTDGFWRRLLLLPFTRKIVGRIEGMVKPSWWVENACMAGLLNWSLDGLRRLRGRGGFSTPRTSLSGAAALRREANPARLFLEESDLHGEIASSELYRNYRQWVCDNGLLPLSSIAFGREVGRAFPDAERIVKRVKGECVKTWRFAPQNNVTDQGVVTDAERIGNKHR